MEITYKYYSSFEMNEKEKEYYEKFKSTEISNEDIKKGEAKAKI